MAQTARTLRSYTPLVLWLVYLLVPVEGWGFFRGRPLGFLSTVALSLVGWLWFTRRSIGLAWLVAAALVLKVVVGTTLLVPRGFDARYYANAEFAGAEEQSFDPASESFTRVDRRLSFGGRLGPDLPLHFLNDKERFNDTRPDAPDRRTLPVSMVWSGWLRVPTAVEQRLYVKNSGAIVTVVVGDRRIATVSANAVEGSGEVPPRAGFAPVAIAAAFPGGVAGPLEVGRIVDGRVEPFDAGDIFRRPVSPIALAADAAARVGSAVIDLTLGLWLVLAFAFGLRGVCRGLCRGYVPSDGLALAWAVVIADAAMFALPTLGRLVILSAGDDWLTYESYARDIGLNSIWMPLGAALGQAKPFYYQPFYPYFLAACHSLFGDSLFGVYFVQRALAGTTIIALWRTTAVLFGEGIGGAGLVAAVAFVGTKLAPWTGVLLTESLFVPLVAICAYVLVRLACAPVPGAARSLGAGALLGIATLTRTSLVLGWILVLPAVAFALRGRPRRRQALVLLVVALGAVMSLATIRNWVAAGQFVPVATSGSTVLHMGNAPATPMSIPAERQATYRRLGLDKHLQAVVEYAWWQPRAFFGNWAAKARYTLGWFDELSEDHERTSAFYVAAWLTALAGLVMLPWAPSQASLCARLIPMLMALSGFATAVMFFPYVYKDRLILPFYALLVPYAGIAIGTAYRWATRSAVALANATLWLGALAVCLVVALGSLPALDVSILILTLVAGGLCLAPPDAAMCRRVCPYLPLAVAVGLWFWENPLRGVEAHLRADLLMLAAALCTGAYVGSGRALMFAAAVMAAASAAFAAWSILSADAGVVVYAFDHAFTSAAAYHDWGVVGAFLGLAMLVLLAFYRGRPAVAGVLAYVAGLGLGLAAWQPLNHGEPFAWTLVVDVAGRLGAAGAACYLIVWIWAAWPGPVRLSGGPTLAVRALQGLLVALFIVAQAGLRIESAESIAMLMVAGLLIGAIHAHRGRNGPATDAVFAWRWQRSPSAGA